MKLHLNIDPEKLSSIISSLNGLKHHLEENYLSEEKEKDAASSEEHAMLDMTGEITYKQVDERSDGIGIDIEFNTEQPAVAGLIASACLHMNGVISVDITVPISSDVKASLLEKVICYYLDPMLKLIAHDEDTLTYRFDEAIRNKMKLVSKHESLKLTEDEQKLLIQCLSLQHQLHLNGNSAVYQTLNELEKQLGVVDSKTKPSVKVRAKPTNEKDKIILVTPNQIILIHAAVVLSKQDTHNENLDKLETKINQLKQAQSSATQGWYNKPPLTKVLHNAVFFESFFSTFMQKLEPINQKSALNLPLNHDASFSSMPTTINQDESSLPSNESSATLSSVPSGVSLFDTPAVSQEKDDTIAQMLLEKTDDDDDGPIGFPLSRSTSEANLEQLIQPAVSETQNTIPHQLNEKLIVNQAQGATNDLVKPNEKDAQTSTNRVDSLSDGGQQLPKQQVTTAKPSLPVADHDVSTPFDELVEIHSEKESIYSDILDWVKTYPNSNLTETQLNNIKDYLKEENGNASQIKQVLFQLFVRANVLKSSYQADREQSLTDIEKNTLGISISEALSVLGQRENRDIQPIKPANLPLQNDLTSSEEQHSPRRFQFFKSLFKRPSYPSSTESKDFQSLKNEVLLSLNAFIVGRSDPIKSAGHDFEPFFAARRLLSRKRNCDNAKKLCERIKTAQNFRELQSALQSSNVKQLWHDGQKQHVIRSRDLKLLLKTYRKAVNKAVALEEQTNQVSPL